MTAPLLTTAQAAAYLGLSVRALQMHVARGNLVPDHWGGRGRMKGHRFSAETLASFVKGDAVESGQKGRAA